jgi:hypothetical protein
MKQQVNLGNKDNRGLVKGKKKLSGRESGQSAFFAAED